MIENTTDLPREVIDHLDYLQSEDVSDDLIYRCKYLVQGLISNKPRKAPVYALRSLQVETDPFGYINIFDIKTGIAVKLDPFEHDPEDATDLITQAIRKEMERLGRIYDTLIEPSVFLYFLKNDWFDQLIGAFRKHFEWGDSFYLGLNPNKTFTPTTPDDHMGPMIGLRFSPGPIVTPFLSVHSRLEKVEVELPRFVGISSDLPVALDLLLQEVQKGGGSHGN